MWIAGHGSRNIYSSGWQAHDPCLSAPSVVWQTRQARIGNRLDQLGSNEVLAPGKKKKSLQLSHWRPKIRLSLLCQRGWTQNPRTFRVNCQNVLQIRFLTQICFAAGVTWRLNIFGLFIRCTSGVAWIEIYGRLVGGLLGWEQHQHAQVFHSNIIL